MPPEAKLPVARELAPITEDPAGLLLGEAFQHLRCNRLLRWGLRRWLIPTYAAALIAPAWFNPSLLLAVLAGAIASYFLLALAYVCWYGWFVNRNRNYKPLCPRCTSRMWQLCCDRCREPVPPLALWLRGMFLSHCPYCGLHLSCRDETLLAWCSTCSRTQPRPDQLYFKPTHVVVWIRTSLPHTPAGEWERISKNYKHGAAFYHVGDKHSASIMYIRDDYKSPDAPVAAHLKNQTRLLLVSSNIPDIHRDFIRGHFGPGTICETVSDVNEDSISI